MQTTVVQSLHINLFSERRKEIVPGVALAMSDGALWFHPSNGDAPWLFGGWDPDTETLRDVSHSLENLAQ